MGPQRYERMAQCGGGPACVLLTGDRYVQEGPRRMRRMLFWKSLPVLAAVAALVPAAAHAQVGVYGMVTGQRFGGVNCPTFAAPCAENSGHGQLYGGAFGAYYEFFRVGPVRLGADARGAILTSNKRADSSAGGAGIFRQYEAMGGARASVATPLRWLRPYAEILVGYTHNNANGLYTVTTNVNNTTTPGTTVTLANFNPSVYQSQPAFKGLIGADVHLGSVVDIRAIELGIGDAFGSSTTVVTTTNTTSATGVTTTTSAVSATSPSSHGLASIGAGLVFRF